MWNRCNNCHLPRWWKQFSSPLGTAELWYSIMLLLETHKGEHSSVVHRRANGFHSESIRLCVCVCVCVFDCLSLRNESSASALFPRHFVKRNYSQDFRWWQMVSRNGEENSPIKFKQLLILCSKGAWLQSQSRRRALASKLIGPHLPVLRRNVCRSEWKTRGTKRRTCDSRTFRKWPIPANDQPVLEPRKTLCGERWRRQEKRPPGRADVLLPWRKTLL